DAAPAVVTTRERAFLLATAAAFTLFCASNQFTHLQWNTGFRGMAPVVPLLFLAAADRLARMKAGALAWIAAPCVATALVITLARATPPLEPHSFAASTLARSWAQVLREGVQLPALRVLRQTLQDGGPAWLGWLSPLLVLVAALALAWLWRS